MAPAAWASLPSQYSSVISGESSVRITFLPLADVASAKHGPASYAYSIDRYFAQSDLASFNGASALFPAAGALLLPTGQYGPKVVLPCASGESVALAVGTSSVRVIFDVTGGSSSIARAFSV